MNYPTVMTLLMKVNLELKLNKLGDYASWTVRSTFAEFHGMDHDLMTDVLKVLQQQKRCEVITIQGNVGVKFFWKIVSVFFFFRSQSMNNIYFISFYQCLCNYELIKENRTNHRKFVCNDNNHQWPSGMNVQNFIYQFAAKSWTQICKKLSG